MFWGEENIVDLKRCWQGLALPPQAAEWDNTTTMLYFRVQQQKLEAFASRLHARLHAASRVSLLVNRMLILIADEVLGGWSLLKEHA